MKLTAWVQVCSYSIEQKVARGEAQGNMLYCFPLSLYWDKYYLPFPQQSVGTAKATGFQVVMETDKNPC